MALSLDGKPLSGSGTRLESAEARIEDDSVVVWTEKGPYLTCRQPGGPFRRAVPER